METNVAEIPIELVKPVVRADGWWPPTKALLMYLGQTEVHTYAFSVAANVILSLFPFIVLMITLALRVFHSQAMVDVLGDFMGTLLPSNQDFVMRNMRALATAHNGTKVFSVVMLLVTSTGVFLPLGGGAEQRVGGEDESELSGESGGVAGAGGSGGRAGDGERGPLGRAAAPDGVGVLWAYG